MSEYYRLVVLVTPQHGAITSEEHEISSWITLWWRDFIVNVSQDGFSDLIQRFGAVLRQKDRRFINKEKLF